MKQGDTVYKETWGSYQCSSLLGFPTGRRSVVTASPYPIGRGQTIAKERHKQPAA